MPALQRAWPSAPRHGQRRRACACAQRHTHDTRSAAAGAHRARWAARRRALRGRGKECTHSGAAAA
jgi:hypothetical protein